MQRHRLPLLLAASILLVACERTTSPAQSASAPVQALEKPSPVPVVETDPVVPDKPAEPAVPASFVVSTNEPFWQARVAGAALVLTGPEGERTYTVESNAAVSDGRQVRATDAAGSLEVAVSSLPCVDDMSGAAFPFSATLSFDGEAPVRGCARPASQPPPRPQP